MLEMLEFFLFLVIEIVIKKLELLEIFLFLVIEIVIKMLVIYIEML